MPLPFFELSQFDSDFKDPNYLGYMEQILVQDRPMKALTKLRKQLL